MARYFGVLGTPDTYAFVMLKDFIRGVSAVGKNRKGFTLVELVVVIAIIGVLAAILVPSMMDYVRKSKLKTANANAKIAYNAVNEYIAWEMHNSGRSLPAILYDFTKGNSVDGVSCTTEPDSVGDKLIYNVLSDNGAHAGTVWVLGAGAGRVDADGNLEGDVIINGKESFAVQWADGDKNAKLWGQFPNPISWSDYSNYIMNGSFHPGWYKDDWSTPY